LSPPGGGGGGAPEWLVRDRVQWRVLGNAVLNIWVPQNLLNLSNR
jgi:hypothetical protein